MRFNVRNSLMAICAILLSAVPALAHHSFAAEFDQDKPISITGVVTRVDWINPHVYVYLAVRYQSGKTVNWSFESLPPGWFHRMGLQKAMFVAGDTITISGYGS